MRDNRDSVNELLIEFKAPMTPGMQLGPYRIEAPIGSGGMGEVFRARDTRLDRTVAIKVLPAGAVADPLRKKRLLQEARAASALNHPNIVTIHDISTEGGIEFLVMEYVPGNSLNELLRPDGLPLSDVVGYGIQIASALAAAHAAGIVHRDIKPANIMITPAGGVKVLDFGVARLDQRPVEGLAETQTQFTTPGTLIGTLSYMSPEQTRGEPVDARSDIFSLGVLLYQAATGRLPFQGASALAIMHAIATVEPPKPSTLNRSLPAGFDRVLSRAMAKARAERIQTAGELEDELRRTAAVKVSRRSPLRLAAFATALAAIGFAGWWAWQRQTAAPRVAPQLQQVTDFAGADSETGPSSASSAALSRDGKLLAFIHNSQVWLKLLPSGDPVQLTRDPSPKFDPAFSPDGARIAYSAISANFSWDTWVVPALGGEPHLWLPNASGLHWTGPDTILFSEMTGEGIHMAVAAATVSRTESHRVYLPPEIRGMAHRSYLSPDGKWVLVAEMNSGGWLPCRIVPADGSSRGNTVGPPHGHCTEAAWSPDGRWMYFGDNAGGAPEIWRQKFPNGTPEQLTFGPSQAQGVAVAPGGKSLIVGIGFVQHSIVVHDETGDHPVTTQGDSIFPAYGDGYPTSVFSPDGSKLYYLVHSGMPRAFGGGELWVHDFAAGSDQPLLPGLLVTSFDLSPDGENIVLSALEANSGSRLWLARIDRRAPPRRILATEGLGPVFGDRGEVYFRGPEGSQWFVFALNPDTGTVRKLVAEPSVDNPIVSPDRKWVVVTVPFQGHDTTSQVRAFPTSRGKPLILCDRCFVKWSRDQKALFVAFRAANAMSVGETFVIPIPPREAFPNLPDAGLTLENARTCCGGKAIGSTGVFPGIHASQYAYANPIIHRNLYRILFH